MNFDDTLLMAYVDGELPESRHNEIERAVVSSSELAIRVAELRASILPYPDAFAKQALPAVPESLSRFVADLARNGAAATVFHLDTAHAADAANTADPVNVADAANDEIRVDATRPATPTLATVHTPSFGAPRPARARQPSAWLAAAFVAGAFFCGAALKVNPHLLSFSERVSPWIEAAAGYQELYARETLSDVGDNPSVDARILNEIHRDDGLPLAVPNLENAGLTFKRLQRLRFHGKPLVQIVYLPEHGAPVALCVVGNDLADQSPRMQHVYGMDVISWNKDKLGYALIGKRTDVDLDALQRHIVDHPGNTVVGDESDTSADSRS